MMNKATKILVRLLKGEDHSDRKNQRIGNRGKIAPIAHGQIRFVLKGYFWSIGDRRTTI